MSIKPLSLFVACSVGVLLSGRTLAESAYVAAVGYGETQRLLKVARISGLGGAPSVSQVQIDISADFDHVNDVAWLTPLESGHRRVAVLGDGSDWVSPEVYSSVLNMWFGYTHHLSAQVRVYTIPVCGPLAVSPMGWTELYDEFQVGWLSSADHPVPGLKFHLGALAGSGFVISADGCRHAGTSITSDNYTRMVIFDSTLTQRMVGNGLGAYYVLDQENYDICGRALAGDDVFFGAIRLRGATGGCLPGVLTRWRIDWAADQIVADAHLYGAISGCYYLSQIAPLAPVPGHVVDAGVLVRNDDDASYNARSDFVHEDYLADSQGWGSYWPDNVDEVLGLNTVGGEMYGVLRRLGTDYEVYALNETDGTYTSQGLTLTWGGSAWSIQASDGDAMSSVSGWGTLVADLNDDCTVDWDDYDIFADCLAGPGITTPPAGCDLADFGNADLEGHDDDVDLADFALFQRVFGG